MVKRETVLSCAALFILTTLSISQKSNAQTRPVNQPAQLSRVNPGLSTSATLQNDEDAASVEVEEPAPTHREEPSAHIRKKDQSTEEQFNSQSRYIEHPNASKGLYLIDKHKIYYYRTKETERNYETSVRLGPYAPVNLVNPSYPQITFDSVYTTHNIPLVLYDYEKDFFKRFGRLGYKLGTGLYVAQGHGQFVNPNAQIAEPKGPAEQFTLVVLPFCAGLIYHFDYLRNQWIIPYGEGGVDAFTMAELRNDNVNKFGANFGASPAAHFSIGATVPLGHDTRSFLDLDREYGINRIGIALEFRDYIALSSKFDFSGTAITGGISAEY